MVLNSFTTANDYNLVSKWLNSRHVFLPTDETFKGICLAIGGKFRQKELWILFVIETIL